MDGVQSVDMKDDPKKTVLEVLQPTYLRVKDRAAASGLTLKLFTSVWLDHCMDLLDANEAQITKLKVEPTDQQEASSKKKGRAA